jgi:thiol:disulfide interchange protein DsbD
MKRIQILIVLLGIELFCKAQNPVHWHFSTKKIQDKTYEIHFTATIDPPWHIYAQDNDKDATLPTGFTFKPNPFVELPGKIKEIGTLKTEKMSDLTIKYYEEDVDFVQVVKLKTNLKTSLSGKIEFMACTEHCLPPDERTFSITIGDQ